MSVRVRDRGREIESQAGFVHSTELDTGLDLMTPKAKLENQMLN